jgi:hypothetical protein
MDEDDDDSYGSESDHSANGSSKKERGKFRI